MENMTPLYGPEDIRALERKVKTSRLLCWLLGLGALAACVSCCALTNSGNAGRMELACVVTWTLAGWIVLYLRRFVTAETKHELQHAAMLNAGEPETLRGRVTVTKERACASSTASASRSCSSKTRRACTASRSAARGKRSSKPPGTS